MQEFKVNIYSSANKPEWDEFVSQSNCDTFLFLRDFMDYHKDRFQDSSLMIYRDSKLVALLPANKENDILFSHQGLTYGGLVYKKFLKSSDAINIWCAILKFLHKNSCNTLFLKELPYVYLENSVNNSMSYILFKTEALCKRVDMHSIINLEQYKLSNSRKEGVKRGKKAGLVVKESETLELFWNDILIPNLKSKHGVIPVHSLSEIKSLKSKFTNNIRQFNVYDQDRIIAGTTIFEMKSIVHCQYISGDSSKNSSGSLDFLHGHLITEVFSTKKFFSFGTSNINAGQQVNAGLQFWKEGFGARSITQGFFEISTKNYKLLEDVMI
ncbi:GNAT family N-acetyltransferase [Winogradskyella sp. DF17]|uniref:GNAT family N-acetyltransferase n=1 Tax=Winogradskyella pelagia TaxID=2819984 RepID=A0ABS3T5E0_9FLAO|nr:GNAT family N-acetyltransferase [Winogradskyella sp. DF17]MBO3117649.1 GNAT family N-acetyltransferase [Winogradskyella sp. DF17]